MVDVKSSVGSGAHFAGTTKVNDFDQKRVKIPQQKLYLSEEGQKSSTKMVPF